MMYCLMPGACVQLKICDFGLARQYGSPLKPYTHLVVTLWYRAPELLLGESSTHVLPHSTPYAPSRACIARCASAPAPLLAASRRSRVDGFVCGAAGARTYSTPVDVWSCGCIMAELLLKAPLFAGKNELAQIDQIFKVLGTPTVETWPGALARSPARPPARPPQAGGGHLSTELHVAGRPLKGAELLC